MSGFGGFFSYGVGINGNVNDMYYFFILMMKILILKFGVDF